MARARTTPKSKKTRAAVKHDSLAATRAGPVVDELAETRETEVASLGGLLDAGEAVISDRGFARATIEDICQKAGVSSDVFHAHFAGKGALLRALNDRFVQQMLAAVDASTRTGSWRDSRVGDVIEIAVRTILDVVMERKGLVRAFLAHGATDRALSAGLRKIGSHMTAKLTHVLGDCVDAGTKAVGEQTVGFALLLSAAIAHHSILVDDWSGIEFTREQIVEQTARAIRAYVYAAGSS